MVITLPKVSRFLTLKVQLAVDEKLPTTYQKYSPTPPISEYYYNGVQYFRLAPKPMLVFDIHNPEIREGWNSNYQISFYQAGFYFLRKMVADFLKTYTSHFQDYYERDQYGIRLTEIGSHTIMRIPGNAGKIAFLQPAFREHPSIPDQIEYGCSFYVNSLEFAAFLSESELIALSEQLNEIKLTHLALQLINADIAYHNMDTRKPVGTLEMNYPPELRPQVEPLDQPSPKPEPPSESLRLPQY